MPIEADPSQPLNLTPVKQALLEIRELRARLAQFQQAGHEPVAIVGVGMRLPGGVSDSSSFWQLLKDGKDAITDVPRDRWLPLNRCAGQPLQTIRGGFLEAVYDFDPEFFHINPREAESLDPQQRLLLEVVWETLENGGIPPDSLAGNQVGVFLGLSNSDYGRKLLADERSIDAHSSINAWSLAAGRIAYFLNTHGPALVIDTACSSSLSALHLACQSLRSRECSVAIVAGANLILSPELNVAFSKTGMLAGDGQCKTFDDSADGYVRSEGCASILLKPLKQALEDRDRVLAVIRGSAINHDGRSAGLTAPNGSAQEAVIREALRAADVAPCSVDYVEAHGTGTALGDPIELEALARAYGGERTDSLQVGAVKTNLGHLEAAAGIAGVLKVVLALNNESLPPSLHFREGNKRLDWRSLPLSVTTGAVPWLRSERPRRAGISSFGFSGTNAHVILEEAPPEEKSPSSRTERPLHLLCLSAASEAALRAVVSACRAAFLKTDADFADICFTANAGRSHHAHRLALLADSRDEAIERLGLWLTSGAAKGVVAGRPSEQKPAVAFIYSTATSYAPEFVHQLQKQFPYFETAFEQCQAVCELAGGRDEFVAARHFSFSVGYALSQLWISLGIKPVVVLGDSFGEYVAAVVAHVISLDDAVQMIGGSASTYQEAQFSRPQVTMVSSVTGRVENERICTLAYWEHRSADDTRFAEALRTISHRRDHFFLQIRPGLQIFETLQSLYCQGIDIDWKGWYRGYSRTKVCLPTYPFQRRTLRVGKTPEAEHAEISDTMWKAAVAAALRQSESGPLGWNVRQYPKKWECLQRLTLAHIEKALFTGGVFRQEGDYETLDSVVAKCGFASSHRRLIDRWLMHLVHARFLRRETDEQYTCVKPFSNLDLAPYWNESEELLSDDPESLAYLRQCAALLVDVLRGRKSPLETLFPGGRFALAEGLYEHSQQARYLNPIVAAAVKQAAQSLPVARDLRAIEIGAGTGGTTAAIVEQLSPNTTEYWFTDLSDLFLARAQVKFNDFSFLRFAKFDLDVAPESQGFPRHSFDLVVAANVIHATRDLRKSLRTVEQLLAPGGLLILCESTTHFAWFDITTGLVEGWQHFDDEIRTGNPLLSAQQWIDLLNESGFLSAQQMPEAGSLAESVGQHVILARTFLTAGGEETEIRPVSMTTVASVENQARDFDVLLTALRQADAVERYELMLDYVRRCLRQVFHLDPGYGLESRDRFSDLGMDSLLALELRTVLERELPIETMPAILAFDTGTPGSLAKALLTFLFPPNPEAKPENGRQAAQPRYATEEIEQLSDADVEELLLQRLQIQGKS